MGEEIKTLGQILKDARKLRCLTQRQVEQDTGISADYVNQLENDQIKSPSAHALYSLSKKYRIELKGLLKIAGIIVNQSNK